MSDEELESLPHRPPLEDLEIELEKRKAVSERRELHRLTDPNDFLNGNDWLDPLLE
jgi:hypothetical protein